MRNDLRLIVCSLSLLVFLPVGHAWINTIVNVPSRNVGAECKQVPMALAAGSTLPDNFNPFQQVSSLRISTRKMRMKAITQELLDAVQSNKSNNPEACCSNILQEHKDFLLEPLDDFENVVWDDDDESQGSIIYSADMTREERYQAYSSSMQERIDSAKHASVRQVLTLLRDFVLSHE